MCRVNSRKNLIYFIDLDYLVFVLVNLIKYLKKSSFLDYKTLKKKKDYDYYNIKEIGDNLSHLIRIVSLRGNLHLFLNFKNNINKLWYYDYYNIKKLYTQLKKLDKKFNLSEVDIYQINKNLMKLPLIYFLGFFNKKYKKYNNNIFIIFYDLIYLNIDKWNLKIKKKKVILEKKNGKIYLYKKKKKIRFKEKKFFKKFKNKRS